MEEHAASTSCSMSSKRKAHEIESIHLNIFDNYFNGISDEEKGSCVGNLPNKELAHKAKDQGSKKETPTSPPARPLEDCSEGYRKQCRMYANLALDYFNKKNHTKYELVEDETMHTNPFVDSCGFWIHCNFKAKDSLIKQFFAEIQNLNGLEEVVATCKFLTGKTHDGCYFCGSFITHPVYGYQAGYPDDYKSLGLRSRSKLKLKETDEPDCRLFPDDKEAPCMAPLLNMELGEEDEDSRPPPTPPVEDCNEAYREQCIKYANLALDYFNKKYHKKYELVEDETMHTNPFVDSCGFWIHCNFKAKDSLSKQFFAEIQDLNDLESVVTTCKILKGKTHAGCFFCHSLIIHPVYGYKAGFPADYKSLGLRSRSKLKSEETDEPDCKVY